jgi:hypothetical protein
MRWTGCATASSRRGRYNPVIRVLKFGASELFKQQPGAGHDSIEAATKAAGADGTRSILDISRIGKSPADGLAAPVPAARLRECFGTERPTRAMVERADELFDSIDRGQCIYIVVYDGETPTELFFAGYSYD